MPLSPLLCLVKYFLGSSFQPGSWERGLGCHCKGVRLPLLGSTKHSLGSSHRPGGRNAWGSGCNGCCSLLLLQHMHACNTGIWVDAYAPWALVCLTLHLKSVICPFVVQGFIFGPKSDAEWNLNTLQGVANYSSQIDFDGILTNYQSFLTQEIKL